MRLAIAVLLVCVSGRVAAQDALERVRELYASADYEGALSALSRLQTGPEGRTTAEMDRYQLLCLVALGRTEEADATIEAILMRDPQYDPAATDAPPRVRAAFSRVRREVLPNLVRTLYADAKAAFDRKAFAEARPKLERTLNVIDIPEIADQLEMQGLRTVIAGLLDLSRSALAQGQAEANGPSRRGTPASPGPVAVEPSTEPVVVQQSVPPWFPTLGGGLFNGEFRGAIEVEIDETGQVSGAMMAVPIHPTYDRLLLAATRDWKYEPARRNGAPVKIRKRVDVVLRPR